MSSSRVELIKQCQELIPDLSVDLGLAVLGERFSSELDTLFASLKLGSENKTSIQDAFTFIRKNQNNKFLYENIEDLSFESLNSCDLLDKSTLQENNTRLLAQDNIWIKNTSGTTGKPLKIPYSDLFYIQSIFLTVRKITLIADVYQAKKNIYCISLTDNPFCKNELWLTPECLSGDMLQLHINISSKRQFCESIDVINQLDAEVITLKPEILSTILDHHLAGDIRLNVCYIICSGANLDISLKEQAEQVLGIRIIEAYGLTETDIVASDCACGKTMKFHSDIFPEIYFDHEDTSQDNKGILVLTSLRNSALPLFRYKTNDLVTLIKTNCNCTKEPSWRIDSIHGRVLKDFSLKSGKKFPASSFHNLFDFFEIDEFQIIQVKPSFLKVRIDSSCKSLSFSAEIVAEIKRRIPEECDVTLVFEEINVNDSGRYQRFMVQN